MHRSRLDRLFSLLVCWNQPSALPLHHHVSRRRLRSQTVRKREKKREGWYHHYHAMARTECWCCQSTTARDPFDWLAATATTTKVSPSLRLVVVWIGLVVVYLLWHRLVHFWHVLLDERQQDEQALYDSFVPLLERLTRSRHTRTKRSSVGSLGHVDSGRSR